MQIQLQIWTVLQCDGPNHFGLRLISAELGDARRGFRRRRLAADDARGAGIAAGRRTRAAGPRARRATGEHAGAADRLRAFHCLALLTTQRLSARSPTLLVRSLPSLVGSPPLRAKSPPLLAAFQAVAAVGMSSFDERLQQIEASSAADTSAASAKRLRRNGSPRGSEAGVRTAASDQVPFQCLPIVTWPWWHWPCHWPCHLVLSIGFVTGLVTGLVFGPVTGLVLGLALGFVAWPCHSALPPGLALIAHCRPTAARRP